MSNPTGPKQYYITSMFVSEDTNNDTYLDTYSYQPIIVYTSVQNSDGQYFWQVFATIDPSSDLTALEKKLDSEGKTSYDQTGQTGSTTNNNTANNVNIDTSGIVSRLGAIAGANTDIANNFQLIKDPLTTLNTKIEDLSKKELTFTGTIDTAGIETKLEEQKGFLEKLSDFVEPFLAFIPVVGTFLASSKEIGENENEVLQEFNDRFDKYATVQEKIASVMQDHYERKDDRGLDKTARDIESHTQKHDPTELRTYETEGGTAVSIAKGHYPSMQNSGYYEHRAEEFSHRRGENSAIVVKNEVDTQLGDIPSKIVPITMKTQFNMADLSSDDLGWYIDLYNDFVSVYGLPEDLLDKDSILSLAKEELDNMSIEIPSDPAIRAQFLDRMKKRL